MNPLKWFAKTKEFIAEVHRMGTSAAALETAEKKGLDTGIRVVHPFDSSWTLPVFASTPMSARRSVVFPAPLRPIRHATVRGGTSKDTSRNTIERP